MTNFISEQMSLEDFYRKILRRFAAINNSLLQSVNLDEMTYLKITNTEEGRKKLASVLEKKPEWKATFIRLEAIRKFQAVIDEEFKNYLPF